jgi:site-specific recombinase XerD
MSELEPIAPADAVELYLSDREADGLREITIQAHYYRLGHFIRFCAEHNIPSMSDVQPRHMLQYKNWRRDDGDLKRVSVHTQLSTLKVFIKWCEDYNFCTQTLHESVRPPKMNDGEDVDERAIDSETAFRIYDALDRYEYASRYHVVFMLMWTTGRRIGGVRALDVEDCHLDGRKGAYIDVRNRPDEGTPLKMGKRGETKISLKDEYAQVLKEYIERNRNDVTDDYGRRPLLTTSKGRPATGTIRNWVYKLTRPCYYSNICPDDEVVIEDCDYAGPTGAASGCPYNFNPHAIRTGAITHALKKGVDSKRVSERMNVSPKVIDKNYDMRTEMDKMEGRRDHFDSIY